MQVLRIATLQRGIVDPPELIEIPDPPLKLWYEMQQLRFEAEKHPPRAAKVRENAATRRTKGVA